MSRYQLEMIKGSDAGHIYGLIRGANGLGRSLRNNIVFPRDNVKVSVNHAIIYVHEDHLSIEDLSSTNGTYVNEERVTTHTLNPGDVVGIAHDGPRFRLLETAGAAKPSPPATKDMDDTADDDRSLLDTAAHERTALAPSSDDLAWTPYLSSADAKDVLERAREESGRRGKPVVDSTDLLLALLKKEEGPVADLLSEAGLTYEAVAQRIKTGDGEPGADEDEEAEDLYQALDIIDDEEVLHVIQSWTELEEESRRDIMHIIRDDLASEPEEDLDPGLTPEPESDADAAPEHKPAPEPCTAADEPPRDEEPAPGPDASQEPEPAPNDDTAIMDPLPDREADAEPDAAPEPQSVDAAYGAETPEPPRDRETDAEPDSVQESEPAPDDDTAIMDPLPGREPEAEPDAAPEPQSVDAAYGAETPEPPRDREPAPETASDAAQGTEPAPQDDTAVYEPPRDGEPDQGQNIPPDQVPDPGEEPGQEQEPGRGNDRGQDDVFPRY